MKCDTGGLAVCTLMGLTIMDDLCCFEIKLGNGEGFNVVTGKGSCTECGLGFTNGLCVNGCKMVKTPYDA